MDSLGRQLMFQKKKRSTPLSERGRGMVEEIIGDVEVKPLGHYG